MQPTLRFSEISAGNTLSILTLPSPIDSLWRDHTSGGTCSLTKQATRLLLCMELGSLLTKEKYRYLDLSTQEVCKDRLVNNRLRRTDDGRFVIHLGDLLWLCL